MTSTRTIAALALVALLAGCSSTPQFQTGPDAEVTHDGLTRLDKTVLDTVWARSDVDLSGYSKVMFDGVGIEFRPVSGSASSSMSATRRFSQSEFRLDDRTKAIVTEEITAAFIEELARSDQYQVVDAAGPDVLMLKVALLDVVSRVPPETVGRSEVFLSSVGDATVVLELRDSQSNAIFARAIDRRAAERVGAGQMVRSNPASNRLEVRRLGSQWARIVRTGIEAALAEG